MYVHTYTCVYIFIVCTPCVVCTPAGEQQPEADLHAFLDRYILPALTAYLRAIELRPAQQDFTPWKHVMAWRAGECRWGFGISSVFFG